MQERSKARRGLTRSFDARRGSHPAAWVPLGGAAWIPITCNPTAHWHMHTQNNKQASGSVLYCTDYMYVRSTVNTLVSTILDTFRTISFCTLDCRYRTQDSPTLVLSSLSLGLYQAASKLACGLYQAASALACGLYHCTKQNAKQQAHLLARDLLL